LLSTSLAAGVDIKVVQEQLGHSSRAITSDTYTTVLPEVARAAAEATAALLSVRWIRHASPLGARSPAKRTYAIRKTWEKPQVSTGAPPGT